MIEDYFDSLEKILRDFPIIQSYTLTKKVYNIYQGYVSGKVSFENGHSLQFVEVVDVESASKVKYRYQYMDAGQNLIFRYDNAPHHAEIETFPRHKHISNDEIEASREPSLQDVLMEIARKMQQE